MCKVMAVSLDNISRSVCHRLDTVGDRREVLIAQSFEYRKKDFIKKKCI
jgi:hypothetical protein